MILTRSIFSIFQKLLKGEKQVEVIEKACYQPLFNVINQIYIQAELVEKHEAEMEEAYECSRYFEDNKGDCAALTLLHALRNNSQGEIDQTIELIGEGDEPESYNLKAYLSDLETLDIMREYAEDVKKFGDSEGYEFTFTIDPDFTIIRTPNCDCGAYEISDTFTVKGNRIDSNCDTWGTSCHTKAQSLYLFFVKELGKLAIAQVRYWVV